MPIYPLPQFEADVQQLEAEDREIYERLKAPQTVVVRFGATYMVGEFLFDLGVKPGCGSKLVVKTHRGTELGEMLTSTCPNSGCDKSVSRKEMLEYIDNSGGRDYPFFQQGKVDRIATVQDLTEQTRLDGMKTQMARSANMLAQRLGLDMKVIEAEAILGGEKLTFYFTSEERVDFREMVSILASEYRTRIEMRQVGARDEARLTADYERCGQHCCCKQFLKVLKPISMRSAKVQKATLDPLKISGRCGRLMCCLRYEDETYEDLRARLPRKKQRVKTEEGWGIVIDTQILTQLALVRLEPKAGAGPEAEVVEIAVPIEELEWEGKTGPTRSKAERAGGAGGAGGACSISDDGDVDLDDEPGEPGAVGAPVVPPKAAPKPSGGGGAGGAGGAGGGGGGMGGMGGGRPRPPAERREGGERREGERRNGPGGGGGGGNGKGGQGRSDGPRRGPGGGQGQGQGGGGQARGGPRPEGRPGPREGGEMSRPQPPQMPDVEGDMSEDDAPGAPEGAGGGEQGGAGGGQRRRRRRRRGGGGGNRPEGGGGGEGTPPSA